MATVLTGAQDTNTPDPAPVITYTHGPVPPILARPKPENSAMPRDGNIAASQLDGPYGGKSPQS